MAFRSTTLLLPSETETDLLGRTLSRYARAGDCLLLRGPIGAGKSAVARAFIKARLGAEVDVPSPTFTLVQTYIDGDIEIWHADLYRLTDPSEVIELGLVDALEKAICLIEWPDLLGDLIPDAALSIDLETREDGRMATLTYGDAWQDRLVQMSDA